jgi:tetratricopeptide (TPR) repeat protein
MKKIIGWGIGLVLLAGALLWGAVQLAAPTQVSQADAETFARANQLYEKGQYAAAANLYQQLVAQGVENADVYYNLGAAFKASGDAQGARQAFARAYELAPRDAQIAEAANAANGFFPALTQNETALGALVLAMALAFALFLVLERYWHVRASAL